MNRSAIINQISTAFANTSFPGNDNLVRSTQFEPVAVKVAFTNKNKWSDLDAAFLDSAPEGMGSAINMFTKEAYKFFLPAYLIADVRGQLKFVEPNFSLCAIFSGSWEDQSTHPFFLRHADFNRSESSAIVSYLNFVARRSPDPMIETALRVYWLPKALGNFIKAIEK